VIEKSAKMTSVANEVLPFSENMAAIDVGSNGIRMIVASVGSNGETTTLESVRESVRLGKDVFTKGYITEETTEAALEAFLKFRKLLYKYGVKKVRAVATSALREAENADIFIDRILQATDIEIQVISPQEEARLIALAVGKVVNLKGKSALLIDIGGGSVEMTFVEDGKITTAESFNSGTVRLLEKLHENKVNEERFGRLVRDYVDVAKQRIQKEIKKRRLDLCIGTGGNVEALGDLRKLFFGKDNRSITKSELEVVLEKLQALTVAERMTQLGLRPDRADVIVPAAIVLQKLLKQAGADELLIPRVGLKDGALLELVPQPPLDKRMGRYEQVLASAIQVGRKYFFDEEHAKTVASFALQIFDSLQDLHGLKEDSRMILETASLLHDIGHFIHMAGHHKHSYYIINATPIFGLSDREKSLVANVARYHRKSPPSLDHENYRSLSSKDRVVVSKLSAILRIAEALDVEHAQRVKKVDIEYKHPMFFLKLQGEGELLLEKWALKKRTASGVFEDTFGIKIIVNGEKETA
jgi:exopolyphosphatase/guanosine-5'-triphosphate,3'-diphosphate pyrophosphatase